MRGVECAVPDCGHVHAEDDEQLVEAVMRHAASAHPEMPFPEDAARQFVQTGAYDDTEHAQPITNTKMLHDTAQSVIRKVGG